MKTNIKPGDQLFMGLVIAPSDRIMQFHAGVWMKSAANQKRTLLLGGNASHIDPGTFMPYDQNTYMAFAKEADYKMFQAWLDKYSQRFTNGIEVEYIPTPGDNRINGYMVPHDINRQAGALIKVPNPVDFAGQWLWIVNNCTGKVYWTFSHWIFEDEQDAVMYKLKSPSNRTVEDEADEDEVDCYEDKSLNEILNYCKEEDDDTTLSGILSQIKQRNVKKKV